MEITETFKDWLADQMITNGKSIQALRREHPEMMPHYNTIINWMNKNKDFEDFINHIRLCQIASWQDDIDNEMSEIDKILDQLDNDKISAKNANTHIFARKVKADAQKFKIAKFENLVSKKLEQEKYPKPNSKPKSLGGENVKRVVVENFNDD